MDEHLAEPGLEAVWFPEGGKLAPGVDEGALQGILGQIVVAQDPGGERVHPVAGQLDQSSECLAVAALGPLDEISHRRSLGSTRRRDVQCRVTLYESVAGPERSAVPVPVERTVAPP